jgi:endoglucanase
MGACLGIKGNQIIKDGKPIRLRGVNFGNWMLIEHFMIGLPWVEYKMREKFAEILGEAACRAFFDTYMDAFIAEDDFRFLADMGANFIRLPFNYRHFEDDRRPGEFRSDAFVYFDRVIELCRRYDMYVLLDLHAAAGVQARDWNAESAYGEAFLWEHPHFTRRSADLWRFIASRYVDEERVMGYEIMNEPLSPALDAFHGFNMACIKAIREVDKEHIIVVESNEWGKKINTLRPEVFEDPLVMPSLHHYPSQFPPFNKIKEYPGEYDGKHCGKAELLDTMKEAFDQKAVDRPFYCGEFNHGNLGVLSDLLSVFEENGIHWTIWSYKSIAMGLVFPRENTPWRHFHNSEPYRLSREGYMKCTAAFVEALKTSVPLVDEGEIRHFMGQSLHHWHGVMLPKVLGLLKGRSLEELRAMARSFAFVNCDVDKSKIEVLRRFCMGNQRG